MSAVIWTNKLKKQPEDCWEVKGQEEGDDGTPRYRHGVGLVRSQEHTRVGSQSQPGFQKN